MPDDLISREELLTKAQKLWDSSGGAYADGVSAVMREIENAPTIAAVPVVHGRWKEFHSKMYKFGGLWWDAAFECSRCREKQPYGESAYCPNCGAKMDGGEENDD